MICSVDISSKTCAFIFAIPGGYYNIVDLVFCYNMKIINTDTGYYRMKVEQVTIVMIFSLYKYI